MSEIAFFILLSVYKVIIKYSPKSVGRQHKKRGLITLHCLLWHRQTPNLSSTKSKSPRYMAQALPCYFLDRFLLILAIFRKQECTS